jgi:hypothetical protein
MKPMMVLEFASTGALEMSWFQGFASGNGRKPFKLASWPTAKPLQLVVLPEIAVTVAVADFVVSAALVAVTVYAPASVGAV